MSVLDDLRLNIHAYPTANCITEIVEVKILGGGAVLNVGETFQFKVRVTNQDLLDMKNVTVRVLGTEFADVGLSSGPLGSSAVAGAFNLDAFQLHSTGFFKGKAKKATNNVARDIVIAQIFRWDANLDHLLSDQSGAGVFEAKLKETISPQYGRPWASYETGACRVCGSIPSLPDVCICERYHGRMWTDNQMVRPS